MGNGADHENHCGTVPDDETDPADVFDVEGGRPTDPPAALDALGDVCGVAAPPHPTTPSRIIPSAARATDWLLPRRATRALPPYSWGSLNSTSDRSYSRKQQASFPELARRPARDISDISYHETIRQGRDATFPVRPLPSFATRATPRPECALPDGRAVRQVECQTMVSWEPVATQDVGSSCVGLPTWRLR